MYKKTEKLSIPTIIVSKGNTALATGALVGSGVGLNIADGQLGVLSYDHDGTTKLGTFIPAATTATQVKAIKIVQGTPKSANLNSVDWFEAGDKAMVESGVISRDKIQSFSAKKFRVPALGAVSLTGLPTTYLDNTNYGFYTELLSVENDRDYGDNDNVLTTVIETPDFTLNPVISKRDYVLTRLAATFNSRSRVVKSTYNTGLEDVVCFGIKVAGGSGVALSTVTVGTSLPITTINGVTSAITADAALVRTLGTLVFNDANILPTTTIEVIDPLVAGAADKIDGLIVVGLPRTKSVYFDNIAQTLTSVKVNPAFGFQPTLATTSTIVKTAIRADEGSGQGWKWTIQNEDRNQLTIHTMQSVPRGEWFSKGVSYIDPTLDYTHYAIEYFDTEETLNARVHSPKRVDILLPATATTPTGANVVTNLTAGNPAVTTTTGNATTKSGLEATLKVWLESARSTFSGFTLKGEATSGTYFV